MPDRSTSGDRAEHRRPTLADVAKLAGVSVSTASRVVTDHPRVDEATRERVRDAVARLGYRTSRLGRALALRRTGTIGLLAPEISNPYFPELILAVEDEARRHGHTSILSNVDESLASTEQFAQALLDHGVDGLLAAGARPADVYLARLREEGVPVVILNRPHPAFSDSYVVPDFRAGGVLAARHLIELGHERLAYMAGPPGFVPSDERLRGHLDELARAGIDYARVAHLDEFTPAAARATTLELLRAARAPTAIAVVNDYCALGVLAAADDLGLRVPDDLAVIGYDDIWVADLPSIQLSSISSHTTRMGHLATQMLIDLVQRDAVAAEPTLLEPELRVRRTCGARP